MSKEIKVKKNTARSKLFGLVINLKFEGLT